MSVTAGGSSRKSGTGRWTLGEFRDGLGDPSEVRDWSRNPRLGLGRVGGSSGRSGMGTGILGEVRDG